MKAKPPLVSQVAKGGETRSSFTPSLDVLIFQGNSELPGWMGIAPWAAMAGRIA